MCECSLRQAQACVYVCVGSNRKNRSLRGREKEREKVATVDTKLQLVTFTFPRP